MSRDERRRLLARIRDGVSSSTGRGQPRVHGPEATAGHLGLVSAGPVIGECPSCGAELRVGTVLNPRSGRVESALQHAMPFCTYFGDTDADEIVRAVRGRRS